MSKDYYIEEDPEGGVSAREQDDSPLAEGPSHNVVEEDFVIDYEPSAGRASSANRSHENPDSEYTVVGGRLKTTDSPRTTAGNTAAAGTTAGNTSREGAGSGGTTGRQTSGASPRKTGKRRRFIDVVFGGDKVLWTIILILLIFSMLLTFSATVYKPGGTPTAKLVEQLVFIVMGIVSLLVVHVIKYQFYGRIASAVFIFGFVLTLLAMLIGPEGAGARRDLDLPIVHIRFQPFEILKIGLIMVLAKGLARRQKNIDSEPLLPSLGLRAWRDNAQRQVDILRRQTIPVLGPILLTCVVTYFSVGNSTTLIIAATCLVMLFIGRIRLADMGKIIGIVAVAGAIFVVTGSGRSDTAASRVASFKPDMFTKHARLNSDSVEVYDYPAVVDAAGGIVSQAEANQSINAKMSIASGEFFGKGPGMSTHRSNLEEAERDFAYAFIIEEYGALGGLAVLLLFLWLFFRTIVTFKRCGTAFPSLLVLGLGLMLILQAMIHMLVSVALFPVTGQQLPLISKGGSSLVFTLMALGMILGVSRQTVEKTLDNPKGESLLEKS